MHAQGGSPSFSCSDLFGNAGGDWTDEIADQLGESGNITHDPEYCDTPSDDYRVQLTSPCAPANNDCGVLIGAMIAGCEDFVCGDANGSSEVDIDDVVYLIFYIFAGGQPPDPMAAGDPDCSGEVDIDDVVYLITYIFAGGPQPCAGC